MDFKAFDRQKIENYKAEAKKTWGDTEAYREYEKKTAGYSEEKQETLAKGLMDIFKEIGEKKEKSPADPSISELVKKLKGYITAHYYACTNEILAGLGQLYAAGLHRCHVGNNPHRLLPKRLLRR